MNENTFPFRLDERGRAFLSALVGVMQQYDARFASHSGGVQVQFLEKGTSSRTIDAPISFTQDGAQMSIPLNAVAKTHPQSREWLKRYQAFVNKSRGEQMEPVPQRCYVMVDARADGQLRYHLTYMVSHGDGSLAQDMPQGYLYATEALNAAASVPASKPASSKPRQQQERASWLD